MGMTVQRRRDDRTPRVLIHKVADIRGGVSVDVSELSGDYLPEGTPLSAPIGGICHVVKVARVFAEVQASETAVKVAKGHQFKVGDFVLADEAKVATAITKIDTSDKGFDLLTLKAALGSLPIGSAIAEAKEESAKTSTLKYKPIAISGTGVKIDPKSNLTTDAWLIAVTSGSGLPSCVAKYLPTIINY